MYKILKKRPLHDTVTLMEIEAPHVARKAQPGQFIIFRIDEQGERIPLTIAGYDRQRGSVTIIFQKVGASTRRLDTLNEGDSLLDFAGPLGEPSHFEGVRKACVIGGGLGVAIAWPQARALYEKGAHVDTLAGFRSGDLVILEEELAAASTALTLMTDDGSRGDKGFVTQALEKKLAAGETYDVVIAIGPLPMMKAVCEVTRPYHIKTIVSMNPVMIDGTGMCGGCRVTVGGQTRFACVDGPDFDGHLVDFDEAIRRSRMYQAEEKESAHRCRLTGGVR
ncbi:MAG: sulfide/dihydroorotate dehydrogenase-like FAD/NAD-binding protein [Clostridia bacterium]|nr:sulfide/dihydroorotate dehydrogenase-like FAD/NAD-binding protein [Clostridia bacterium]